MSKDKSATATKAKKAAKKIAQADTAATHKAAKLRDKPWMKAIASLSEVADQPPLIAASLGTLAIGLATRRADLTRGGARMLLSHLLATGAKMAIKHQFDRTRPSHALDGTGHHFEKGDEGGHEDKSFPSGHTAGAVAVARAVSRDIDGAAVPAAVATVAVAAAQVPTGHHYFSDIAVGAAIGWAAEAIVSAIFDRIEPRVTAAITHSNPPLQGEGNRSAQPSGGGVSPPD